MRPLVEVFEFFRSVSLMVKAVIERDQMTNPNFQRVRAKSAKHKLVSILNVLISVNPLQASPNQIVLVGRNPAHTDSFGHT